MHKDTIFYLIKLTIIRMTLCVNLVFLVFEKNGPSNGKSRRNSDERERERKEMA
jgi:hypothetical protein